MDSNIHSTLKQLGPAKQFRLLQIQFGPGPTKKGFFQHERLLEHRAVAADLAKVVLRVILDDLRRHVLRHP